MRVELHEPGHHRQCRRIDELEVVAGAGGVIAVGVCDDARDPVALDRDIDVRSRRRTLHVDELAGMNDDVRRGNRRRVFEVERYGASFARLDVDDAELVETLIEDVARVALPARRVRALARHAARRPQRLTVGRNRPHGEHAFVDRGHLRAVGRPRGSASTARIDRQQRRGSEPFVAIGT